MSKIILFMAYYGKLPSYFDVWLKAVENNESIDFCIISDLLKDKRIPENVKLMDISFEEFKKAVQDKFDFKISLNNYGRISQFRPALAYVFPDVVRGYDYWGFIECDLIPGNIRKFITDDILEKNDKIFKLGHFQIFKNNEKMNTLFMKESKRALSYRFAFGRDILFFEELLGMHNIAEATGCKTYTSNVFADIKCYELMFECSPYSYENQANTGKCLFAYKNGTLERYTLKDNGTVIKDEVLYVHLQKRVMEVNTPDFNDYIIIPNSFVKSEEINKDYFESVNKSIMPEVASYGESMRRKLDKARKDRFKKLDWWLLRFKRYGIRKNHGVDLNGK